MSARLGWKREKAEVPMGRDEIGGRGDREPFVPRRARLALALGALTVAAAVGMQGLDGPSPEPAPPAPRADAPVTPRASATGPAQAPERDSARVGFIGLPPAGTAPSSPRQGRLVLQVWTRLARVWVYADGRLITLRYEDRPEGANPLSTGLLVQRLSPSGVERLRSFVARSGTGLGPAPDRPATGPAKPLVRVGGRLRVVDRPAAACDARSCPRVTSPESWLPPGAWQARRLSAYVPVRFAVCYGLRGSKDTADVRAGPAVPDASLFGRTVAGDRRLPADWPCSVVTTRRAARIVETLRGARVLRDSAVGSRILAYVIDVRSPRPGSPPHEARLFFEPLLPDDRWPCSACA
jgi:hypothetical protein